jgi:hypothetical protein
MPIIYAEGFLEPPCLTLPGEPLVLQERVEGGGTDNEPITLNLLPLVPEFINTEFHIYSFCTFKIFVRSRRDQEKKYRIGIRHSPSTDRYVFEKIVAFYSCPFCIVTPTSGGERKEGEGEEPWGAGGAERDVNEIW